MPTIGNSCGTIGNSGSIFQQAGIDGNEDDLNADLRGTNGQDIQRGIIEALIQALGPELIQQLLNEAGIELEPATQNSLGLNESQTVGGALETGGGLY